MVSFRVREVSSLKAGRGLGLITITHVANCHWWLVNYQGQLSWNDGCVSIQPQSKGMLVDWQAITALLMWHDRIEMEYF